MAPKETENEIVRILTFGTLIGGSGPNCRRWEEVIDELGRGIRQCIKGLDTPLKLSIAFHIPGNMLKPEFSGVRTGSYFKKLAVLVVQVAIPEKLPDDVPDHIEKVTHQAIDEAARWAAKRRLEFDARLFHGIVEQAGQL
jgi:hypothetical protein